jgi:hypothetical protein
VKTSISKLYPFLLCVLFFFGQGCGTSESYVAGATGPQAIVCAGRVGVGTPVGGATVVAQTLEGRELARTTTADTGNFVFRGITEQRFRVVADSDRFALALAAEVDNSSGDERFVVLNIPTTVVSRFLQSNPGETLDSAEQRFRSLAGIVNDLNLGYGIEESVRCPFSHLSFFRNAEAAGGVESFIENLVAEMGASNQAVQFFFGARFQITPEDLSHDFTQLTPELASAMRSLQGDRTLVLGVTTTLAKDVLGFVGEEAASSVLDAGIDTGWTKFAEQVGLNFGTTVALDNIEEELGQVIDQLTDIENEISASEYLDDMNALADEIAFIEALSSDGSGIAEPYGVTAALTSYEGSVPGGQPSDEPLAPTNTVNSFIGSLLGFGMAQALTEIADKQVDMNTLWRENKVDAIINTTVSPQHGDFPVRSNYWLEIALGNFNYYATYQRVAANWLVEVERQNNQLGDSVNSVLPTLQSVAAALRQQRSQFPAYQVSDDLLVDLNAGLIWSLQAQGPMTYDDAVSYAASYTVEGTGPSGQTLKVGGFRLPTFEEYRFLNDRARYCKGDIPSGDTPTPVNSDDGVGDYGRVTQGLQRLGFKSVNTVFTSSSNGGSAEDGGVWYRDYATDYIYEGETHAYALWSYTEMELNHESGKSKVKNDSDERPFLMCRQIFSVLNDVNGPEATTLPEFFTSTPSELQDKTPDFDFYPSYGVLSSVSEAEPITNEKFGAALQFAIESGHSVTIGGEVSHDPLFDDRTSSVYPTYAGTNFNALQEFLWFTTDNPLLTVSSLPPAFPANDSSDNPLTYIQALNVFGPVGTLIWNTSDTSNNIQAQVTAHAYGWDGTNFPVELTSNGTVDQLPVDDSGQARQLAIFQVSPRNRIYDTTFAGSSSASERYGATLFFDNKTLASTTDVTWELQNIVNTSDNTAYMGGGLDISNVTGDEGLLQIDLTAIPTTGVDFEIKATHTASGRSDTVSARAIGTP